MKAIPLSVLLVLLLSLPSVAQADVTNKVNYSRDVIYQIVTDRFSDGNPSNNPTGAIYSQDCRDLHKYCGGDWQGIIDKINDGYLTDLGITAIWISQPVENVYACTRVATHLTMGIGQEITKEQTLFMEISLTLTD